MRCRRAMRCGRRVMFRGELKATCHHIDRGLALYEVGRHGTQALTFGGHDARECALALGSTALFLLGYPERALARNTEAVAHALALGQPQVVAHAHDWELDVASARRRTRGTRSPHHPGSRGSPRSTGSPYTTPKRASWPHGAPSAMRGITTPPRRCEISSTGARPWARSTGTPISSCCSQTPGCGSADRTRLRAAINEGLARAEATGEHFCTAELHRLRARACLALDASDARVAEAALDAALADARHRSSRIFELRAACDLARLWADRGERRNAHNLLAPVYGWFTEGFNTADLKGAKALLEDLA